MLFTVSVYFYGLGGCGARPQTFQIVQFGHQVLHQVVFSEGPLVEHLGEQRKQLRKTHLPATMHKATVDLLAKRIKLLCNRVVLIARVICSLLLDL